MRYERTRNQTLIGGLLRHPRVYPYASDDFSPPREEFRPSDNELLWYVIVWADDGALLGMFPFVPHSRVCWEIHCALLPEAYGPTSKEALRGVLRWVWASSPCRRVIASVPIYNRLAIAFGRGAGMREYGRNPQSFFKFGILHDQILLGASPEEES